MFLCSDEVAAVCPKCSLRKRNDRRAGTAVEARNPLSRHPVLWDIFALMRVCTGENESAKAILPQVVAQNLDPIGDII